MYICSDATFVCKLNVQRNQTDIFMLSLAPFPRFSRCENPRTRSHLNTSFPNTFWAYPGETPVRSYKLAFSSFSPAAQVARPRIPCRCKAEHLFFNNPLTLQSPAFPAFLLARNHLELFTRGPPRCRPRVCQRVRNVARITMEKVCSGRRGGEGNEGWGVTASQDGV